MLYTVVAHKSMIIKDIKYCEEFTAGDGTRLCELLHADKEDAEINYSLAHAIVEPGKTSIPHKLKTSEVYYILSGKGEMHIDDETETLRPGQAVYIPPNATQYIKNSGGEDLKFICIVDPAWKPEDEEVLDELTDEDKK